MWVEMPFAIMQRNISMFLNWPGVDCNVYGAAACPECFSLRTDAASVFVAETMFPPVFDHRLKAQLAKPGQRLFLEATVSGCPAPEVVWKKDGQHVDRQSHSVRQEGSRHILVIESGECSPLYHAER